MLGDGIVSFGTAFVVDFQESEILAEDRVVEMQPVEDFGNHDLVLNLAAFVPKRPDLRAGRYDTVNST
jgi:hypothetical protein